MSPAHSVASPATTQSPAASFPPPSPGSSPAPARTPNSLGPPTPGQAGGNSLQQLEQMVMPGSKDPNQQSGMSPHYSSHGSPMGPKTPQSPSRRGSSTPLSPQQWQSRPSSKPTAENPAGAPQPNGPQ